MVLPETQRQPRPLWLEKISFDELCDGGYINLRPSFNNELINCRIHPLFDQEQWIGLSKGDYALLRPSLQLATRLLESPRFLSFWFAILKPRQHVRANWLINMYGRLGERIDLEDRDLTRPEKTFVLQAFRALTNCHNFQFVEETSLNEADATTHMLRHPGFPGFSGHTHGSLSTISDAYLNLLRAHALWAEPPYESIPEPDAWPTDASITRTSFHLAKTLVHELCHAFNNARISLNPNHPQGEIRIKLEPFFMDQRRGELGRAWESFVFGGHIDGIGDGLHMHFGISVTKWPHPFSQEGVERAKSRWPYKTSYAIPMPWVEGLWTNDFWDRVDDTNMDYDFRIPKVLGVRKASDVVWTRVDESYECFSETGRSELSDMTNEQRAAELDKRMRKRIRARLGLEGEYEDSEDSSVARHEDEHGVIRDGG